MTFSTVFVFAYDFQIKKNIGSECATALKQDVNYTCKESTTKFTPLKAYSYQFVKNQGWLLLDLMTADYVNA